jgi:hypothetical protein
MRKGSGAAAAAATSSEESMIALFIYSFSNLVPLSDGRGDSGSTGKLKVETSIPNSHSPPLWRTLFSPVRGWTPVTFKIAEK